MTLCRINKGVYLCLLEHANTKKHVYEHSCSSVRAFLSILAHSAHLTCFFSLILNRIKKMFWFKHTNTRKHVSEQSWLSGWIILIILAHLAHLAQSYFSLIFSAVNTYNCFWFDLTKFQWLKMVKSDQYLRLFSSRRQPPLLVVESSHRVCGLNWDVAHVSPFCRQHGKGLASFSEQTFERLHSKWAEYSRVQAPERDDQSRVQECTAQRC